MLNRRLTILQYVASFDPSKRFVGVMVSVRCYRDQVKSLDISTRIIFSCMYIKSGTYFFQTSTQKIFRLLFGNMLPGVHRAIDYSDDRRRKRRQLDGYHYVESGVDYSS